VLLCAVFLPLGLAAYDATIAPAFGFVRTAEGSPAEVGCALLSLCVWLPWELVSSVYGLCEVDDVLIDLAGEFEGGMQELALAEEPAPPDEVGGAGGLVTVSV
jgi:hypothetical protein